MHVFYTPRYYAEIGAGHVFPIRKFELVRDKLLAEGTLRPDEIFEPDPASVDDVLLVHGSTRDPLREYVTDSDAAEENMAVQGTQRALHGHTHVPVAWLATPGRVTLVQARDTSEIELGAHRSLINPGSVGQPRDGDPRAAYLLLDQEQGRVSWHRVEYDITRVQTGMRAAGLPERLATRLSFGL